MAAPESEELLVAPDSEELVAPGLLASYSSSSDEAAAVAKGKSTGKPAMEFTPESEELVALGLLAKYSSSSDEAAAVAKGKSTGKPAMEFNELKLDDAPESEELLVPNSLPPASETTVPDSLPSGAFLCPRCHLVHEDRESWNRAHSLLYPCMHCGLVHMDYWLSSPLRRDEFDCTAALAVKREMEEAEQSWRNMNNKQEKVQTAR